MATLTFSFDYDVSEMMKFEVPDAKWNNTRYLHQEVPQNMTNEQLMALDKWLSGQVKLEIDENGNMTIV